MIDLIVGGERSRRDALTVHTDRGSSMRSEPAAAGGIPSSPELPGEVWISRPDHAANAARRRCARFVSFLLTHSGGTDQARLSIQAAGRQMFQQSRRA